MPLFEIDCTAPSRLVCQTVCNGLSFLSNHSLSIPFVSVWWPSAPAPDPDPDPDPDPIWQITSQLYTCWKHTETGATCVPVTTADLEVENITCPFRNHTVKGDCDPEIVNINYNHSVNVDPIEAGLRSERIVWPNLLAVDAELNFPPTLNIPFRVLPPSYNGADSSSLPASTGTGSSFPSASDVWSYINIFGWPSRMPGYSIAAFWPRALTAIYIVMYYEPAALWLRGLFPDAPEALVQFLASFYAADKIIAGILLWWGPLYFIKKVAGILWVLWSWLSWFPVALSICVLSLGDYLYTMYNFDGPIPFNAVFTVLFLVIFLVLILTIIYLLVKQNRDGKKIKAFEKKTGSLKKKNESMERDGMAAIDALWAYVERRDSQAKVKFTMLEQKSASHGQQIAKLSKQKATDDQKIAGLTQDVATLKQLRASDTQQSDAMTKRVAKLEKKSDGHTHHTARLIQRDNVHAQEIKTLKGEVAVGKDAFVAHKLDYKKSKITTGKMINTLSKTTGDIKKEQYVQGARISDVEVETEHNSRDIKTVSGEQAQLVKSQAELNQTQSDNYNDHGCRINQLEKDRSYSRRRLEQLASPKRLGSSPLRLGYGQDAKVSAEAPTTPLRQMTQKEDAVSLVPDVEEEMVPESEVMAMVEKIVAAKVNEAKAEMKTDLEVHEARIVRVEDSIVATVQMIDGVDEDQCKTRQLLEDLLSDGPEESLDYDSMHPAPLTPGKQRLKAAQDTDAQPLRIKAGIDDLTIESFMADLQGAEQDMEEQQLSIEAGNLESDQDTEAQQLRIEAGDPHSDTDTETDFPATPTPNNVRDRRTPNT